MCTIEEYTQKRRDTVLGTFAKDRSLYEACKDSIKKQKSRSMVVEAGSFQSK